MKKIIICSLVFNLLVSCASQTQISTATAVVSAASEAQGTLIQFFDLLNAKQYADADKLYGGDYEQLKVFSADTDSADHAKLWADACQLAGLQCLKVRSAAFKNLQGDTYIFQVEFSNSDGVSLFWVRVVDQTQPTCHQSHNMNIT